MDNSEGRMGVDFGEIRITRRIYRSGESEYLLNGRRVRLRDITERILTVGLGPDNYTVIGQGAVDELIAQKPEERRIALENAADVRRHQLQLNETRSRLSTTEENLTRCRDVLVELDPQVRRMRSHADRAGRAREARQELQVVSRRLYRHQYRTALQHRTTAEQRRGETEVALRFVEEELTARDLQWRALETESESLGQDLTEADRLVRDLRGQRDALQSQLLRAREQELALEAESRATSESQARFEREQLDLVSRSESLEARRLEAEANRANAQRELSAIQDEERTASAAARSRRDALVSSNTQLLQLHSQVERERQSFNLATQKAAGLRAAHAGVVDEIARLDEAVDTAQTAVQAANTRSTEARAELELAESKLTETEREVARLDAELQKVRTTIRAAEQEHARLEAARAALDESLQRLVTDAAGETLRKASRGVLGVLGPSLRVRDGYERLISAALADRVGYVVMDTLEAAGELAKRVMSADERAALVLSEFNDASMERSVGRLHQVVSRLSLPEGALLGFATDVAECDADLRAVVRRYLGCTLMLDTIEHAIDVADNFASSDAANVPWQLVTRDGHVLRWNGEWRSGSDQRQVRLVAGRAELAAIEQEIAASRETSEPERVRLAELESQHQHQLEQRGQFRNKAQETRSSLNLATAEVDKQRRLLGLAQQARTASDARHSAAQNQLRTLEESIATAESRIAEIATLSADLEEQRARAQTAAQSDEVHLTALRARMAEHQRLAAGAEAQLQSVADEQRREARLQVEIQERSQALLVVQLGLQTRGQRLIESTADHRKRIAEIDTALPEADQRLEGLLSTMNQLAGRRTVLGAEMNEIRARVRQAQTVHDAAGLELTRTIEDLIRLEREIADELEDLGDDRSVQMALSFENRTDKSPSEPETDPSELQREVRRLKRELSRLGPVDDAALSEYQELIDRHEFLTQQSVDLERASESLKSAMADLEVLIQGGLDATLTEVNNAFQRTFERLFKGGEARLVWSNPDEPIASGIDIVAQPPGKRLQPLGNFSGGERALASVALVFALLQVNPTPFCVLDEVDAALDESNVGRFADIIREWSSRTQFIVVTHNRNTMEIADSLFGISMDTHGVSRVVSLKLDQVLAAAEG